MSSKKVQKAPGEVGNTSTSPSANKQDSAKAIWLLTLKAKDSSNRSIKEWIQKHCDNAVWQIEKGAETGYVHYQITMKLLKKQRLTWLKNHFARQVHGEIANNVDACYDYCQKGETRLAGPFYHPEPLPAVRDPLEGRELYPWQQQVIDIVNTEPDDTTIHWFWEPDGCAGKTALCKHLCLKYDAEFATGKKTDIAYALSSRPKVVLIPLTRSVEGRVSYDAIEAVKDGLIFSGKYDSKGKIFDCPHVFVFANWPPDLCTMSSHKWNVVRISTGKEEERETWE